MNFPSACPGVSGLSERVRAGQIMDDREHREDRAAPQRILQKLPPGPRPESVSSDVSVDIRKDVSSDPILQKLLPSEPGPRPESLKSDRSMGHRDYFSSDLPGPGTGPQSLSSERSNNRLIDFKRQPGPGILQKLPPSEPGPRPESLKSDWSMGHRDYFSSESTTWKEHVEHLSNILDDLQVTIVLKNASWLGLKHSAMVSSLEVTTDF